ncbi:MAG: hypothetical protein OXU86_01675 [Thaumarchaeota archaeon]|nr:hypothetical protein [Nitrososphaerota archaeon]
MASLRNVWGIIWRRLSGSAIDYHPKAGDAPKACGEGGDGRRMAMTRKLTLGGPYVPSRRKDGPDRRTGDEVLYF